MADYTAVFSPALTFTSTASAAITGGQLVKVSGDATVAPTTAIADRGIVVAGHDAASGAKVTLHRLDGIVHDLVATAAVTAGAQVEPSATAGQVQTLTTGTRVGVALTTAGVGALVRVLGRGA